MRSLSETLPLVDVQSLRVGMYVELGLGWLEHPFPTSSFKLSSGKQIETIRGLGLKQVRVDQSKNDSALSEWMSPTQPDQPGEAERNSAALEQALLQERKSQERLERKALIAEQQRSLLVCERRFADAVRQYRKTLETIPAAPKVAGELCYAMVSGFVGEILGEGESAIRLLSEAAGDKSSMHPVNVTVVSLLLGKALGLQHKELVDLGVAAFLHDVGKTLLPDRVRWREDSFSSAELNMYQDHVGNSVQLGKSMGLSNPALVAISQHHELTDGSGFPLRQKGESMAMPSRILSLVNRYDNLCNPSRPASAMTPHESLALMFVQLKSRFDPVVLSAFIRMMGVYPPGSVVQLADERFGLVVSVNSARPLKPRVLICSLGVPQSETPILNLEQEPHLSIRRSLKPQALPEYARDFLMPRQRISFFFEHASEPAQETLA
jgi:HD-GYP domain-containing protein (c-di-GMP phosphodiesterase class II)